MRKKALVIILGLAMFFPIEFLCVSLAKSYKSIQISYFMSIFASPEGANVPARLQYDLSIIKNKTSDIVFLGDSRTKYFVNSSLIADKLKMTVLNAGLPAFYFFYWPVTYSSVLASGHYPRAIIFSIEHFFLFGGQNNNDMVSHELLSSGDYSSINGLRFMFEAYRKNLISFNILMQYASHTVKSYLDVRYIAVYLNGVFKYKLQAESDLKCVNSGIEVNCNNNDGYFLSNITKDDGKLAVKSDDFTIAKINPLTEFFFMKMINEAHRKNIATYVIIPPLYHNKILINTEYLSSRLGSTIIDMSSSYLIKESSVWIGDTSHLNKKGRDLYSEDIAAELQKHLH